MTTEDADQPAPAAPLVRFAVECTPVSVNRGLAFGRGHAYTPELARDYNTAVYANALAWRVDAGYYGSDELARRLQGGRVRFTFWGVKGDADNYGKITLDGVSKAFGVNDKTFSEVTCRKVTTRPALHAGVRVEMWPAAPAEPVEPGAGA